MKRINPEVLATNHYTVRTRIRSAMKRGRRHNHSSVFIVFALATTGLLSIWYGGCSRSKVFKVGVAVTTPAMESYFEGFRAGMAELGYTEGKNLTYVYDGPSSEQAIASVLEDLRRKKADLIFAVGEPAALQAQKTFAGTNVPVIFTPVLNAVELGLVKDVAMPGGNVTGVQLGDFTGKRLEWLKKIAPRTKRVFVPHEPAFRNLWIEGLKQNAPALGIAIVVREVRSKEDLFVVLADLPKEVDAIFLPPDRLLLDNIDRIVTAAIDRNLPLEVTNNSQVKEGALLSFGTDRQAVGEQAARMADQVLKGVSPGEVPVETAEYFLTINLRTAESIGLDIPDSILQQADTIVR
jgi:putative ABC transport system substrate-binding protein